MQVIGSVHHMVCFTRPVSCEAGFAESFITFSKPHNVTGYLSNAIKTATRIFGLASVEILVQSQLLLPPQPRPLSAELYRFF